MIKPRFGTTKGGRIWAGRDDMRSEHAVFHDPENEGLEPAVLEFYLQGLRAINQKKLQILKRARYCYDYLSAYWRRKFDDLTTVSLDIRDVLCAAGYARESLPTMGLIEGGKTSVEKKAARGWVAAHAKTELLLGKLRLKRGLSRVDVAAAMGVSGNLVRMWEQGKKRPRQAAWPELAKMYGVSLERFVSLLKKNKPR